MRQLFQNAGHRFVDPLLHPRLIVDDAVDAALGPTPPEQTIRPRVDEIDEKRPGVVHLGPALLAKVAKTFAKQVASDEQESELG